MPTTIDDIRAALESVTRLALGGPMRPEHNDALDRLRALVAAYDALAPDWAQAPPDAHRAVIMPNGDGYWSRSEPEVHDFEAEWIFAPADADRWREDPLPRGVDWRLCCWARDEV